MARLKEAVLKIDKDWFMYYIGQPDYEMGEKVIWEYEDGSKSEPYNPIEEYDKLNDWIISELEHELDLYYECKEEGIKDYSWVTKDNIRKVKRVLDNYYNGKYIEE